MVVVLRRCFIFLNCKIIVMSGLKPESLGNVSLVGTISGQVVFKEISVGLNFCHLR
jgi:hypothetical protein